MCPRGLTGPSNYKFIFAFLLSYKFREISRPSEKNSKNKTTKYLHIYASQKSITILITCFDNGFCVSRHVIYRYKIYKVAVSLRMSSAYTCVWWLFVIRCHTLMHVGSTSRRFSERSEHVVIRTRMSELVPYGEKCYACTKTICVCRQKIHMQRARYAHAMRTFCASAAR